MKLTTNVVNIINNNDKNLSATINNNINRINH
jgi:hypothetical protein